MLKIDSIFALIPGKIYIKNVYELFPTDLPTVQQQLDKNTRLSPTFHLQVQLHKTILQ